jgi:microcin C transport system substrate-binding protein
VRFDFKSNENRTLALDLATLPVLPEHWWKTRDFANGGGFEPPLGSGPYKSARSTRAQHHLQRDPDWWGKDLPVSRGLYNFDRLTVNFYGDTDIARQLLKAGAFDYNREFSATGFSIGYDSPALTTGACNARICQGQTGRGPGLRVQPAKPDVPGSPRASGVEPAVGFEWTNRQMMRNMYMRQQSYFPRVKWPPPPCPTPASWKSSNRCAADPRRVFTQVFRRRKPMAAATSATSSCKPWHCSKRPAGNPRQPTGQRRRRAAEFTFLDGQGGFDRLLLPYKRTLAQIGIT